MEKEVEAGAGAGGMLCGAPAWQGLCLCAILGWIATSSALGLSRKARSLVRPWVSRCVASETHFILAVQLSVRHAFLDTLFSVLSCVVSVPFYTAFLPLLFWLVECRGRFAAAHLAYLQSLRNTGATLRQFAEADSSLVLPPGDASSVTTAGPGRRMRLPPSPPPLPPSPSPPPLPPFSPDPKTVGEEARLAPEGGGSEGREEEEEGADREGETMGDESVVTSTAATPPTRSARPLPRTMAARRGASGARSTPRRRPLIRHLRPPTAKEDEDWAETKTEGEGAGEGEGGGGGGRRRRRGLASARARARARAKAGAAAGEGEGEGRACGARRGLGGGCRSPQPVFAYPVRPQPSNRDNRSGHSKLGRQMTLLMAFCDYIGNSIKDLVSAPRPSCPPVRRITATKDEKENAMEYGLPSSHALNTVCLSGFLLHYVLANRLHDDAAMFYVGFALVFSLVLLIGLGRIYLGMHSLIDVLAGIAIGLVILAFWLTVHEYVDNFIVYGQNVMAFWAGLSLLLCFAYPTPELPTPSFKYHMAFNGVVFGIVSGIQQTYYQFHHEDVPRILTMELSFPTFIGRTFVGLPIILIVKFGSKAIAKWLLSVLCNTLSIPIRSSCYIPSLKVLESCKKLENGQSGYLQRLLVFLPQESYDVDTGITFLQYAGLAWSVVDLVPSIFNYLRL